MIKSPAFGTEAAGVALDALLPVAAAATSNGFAVSTPPYSKTRMSGAAAEPLNFTVSTLALADAARIFLA
jgi:hypothetical protein